MTNRERAESWCIRRGLPTARAVSLADMLDQAEVRGAEKALRAAIEACEDELHERILSRLSPAEVVKPEGTET